MAYHKDETQTRKDLIERGKKFVGLSGFKHMSYHGLAFDHKKDSMLNMNININGRIMVDPAGYRRNHPHTCPFLQPTDGKDRHEVTSQKDDETLNGQGSKDAKATSGSEPCIAELGDEDYLIASPIVLGFALTEKKWLTFAVSGLKEISWNEHAYDSLVLDEKAKGIVRVCIVCLLVCFTG